MEKREEGVIVIWQSSIFNFNFLFILFICNLFFNF